MLAGIVSIFFVGLSFLGVLYIYILAGGLDQFLFFHILGTIIPTDEYFFRGVGRNHQPDS